MKKYIFSEIEQGHRARTAERQRQQQEFEEVTKAFIERVGNKDYTIAEPVEYFEHWGDWCGGNVGYSINKEGIWLEHYPKVPPQAGGNDMAQPAKTLAIEDPLSLFTLSAYGSVECADPYQTKSALEQLSKLPEGSTVKISLRLGRCSFDTDIDIEALTNPERLGACFLVGLLESRNEL